MNPFRKNIGITRDRVLGVNRLRTSIILYNNSANTIYIGNKGVATANGLPLKSSSSMVFKLPEDDPSGEVWAIADGASSDLRIYEGFGVFA